MTKFVIITLALLLLSTDVNCGKNKDTENDGEYEDIKKLVKNVVKKNIGTLEEKLEEATNSIKSLEDEMVTLKAQGKSGSSTFTRWGHTECGGDAKVVYAGYMASSFVNHTGGGSNYLCLTPEPKYGKLNKDIQKISLLTGVEYQLGESNTFHDAPCVVCIIPRSSVIMIPGTNQCEDGWNLEYGGYLAAQAFFEKRTEFICLDEYPQNREGGGRDLGSGHLYRVEIRLGALPQPPFLRGYELTCAVCSFESSDRN